MKNTKRNKTGIKPISIGELKTWLDGYCSAHGNDWYPTLEQWNMIKKKIFSLENNIQQEMYNAPPQYNQQYEIAPMSEAHVPVNNYEPIQSLRGPEMISVSDRPAMIHRDGKMVTPSSDTPGGPSSFA